MRYFIEIAYKGKNYFGWQRQPKQISVQQVLEESLSTILRKEIKIIGAGRTDTGVHAKQIYAHFDFNKLEDKTALIFRLNSFLPKDISIISIKEVNENAHARFDAVEREYKYFVSFQKDPFSHDFSYLINRKPNIVLMNKAAEMLLTHTNFQCFSRSKTDVKTYNCVITRAFWEEKENNFVFTIVADRFLRNMVRAIVGTLLNVGLEKTSIDDFQTILNSKNRSMAGASAPAKGLFLVKVKYPESVFLNIGIKKI